MNMSIQNVCWYSGGQSFLFVFRHAIITEETATNAQATQSERDLAWWPVEARPLLQLREMEKFMASGGLVVRAWVRQGW